jgi:hypothetical protein
MLDIYYRYCPGDHGRDRPSWFSKDVCLKSLEVALYNFVDSGCDFRITFIIDNSETLSANETKMFAEWERKHGAVVEKLNLKNNIKTYLYTLNLLLQEGRDEDVCFLVEDDYIFVDKALSVLYRAYLDFGCGYITPYDHPVRYDDEYKGGADEEHWLNKIFITEDHHFRTQESTCMTYLSSRMVIREDLSIHKEFCNESFNCPHDRELFRCLQKLGQYGCYNKHKKRLLLGPIPSLATHCHKKYMAPCVKWNLIVNNLLKEENDRKNRSRSCR